MRYDLTCNSTNCSIPIQIAENLQPPIYFYYELNNFFQNHRVYLESRDDEQLYGTFKQVDQLESCNPVKTNSDITQNDSLGPAGYLNASQTLDPNGPATPCGLIAKTFFTGNRLYRMLLRQVNIDTYQLFKATADGKPGDQVAINEKGISWKYDRDNFKNTEHKELQWHDHEDGKPPRIANEVLRVNRAFSGLDAGGRAFQVQETVGQD